MRDDTALLRIHLLRSFVIAAVLTGAASTARAASFDVTTYTPCDGFADDTVALQALVSSAPPGSEIVFPGPTRCRTTAALHVTKPLELRGLAPSAGIERIDVHPIGGTHASGAIVWIESSDVVVEGLHLVGQAYGSTLVRNTHGIWAITAGPTIRFENITIRDNTVERLRGRGIALVYVDDFIISGNHVEDVGYSGIWTRSVRRGWIRDNVVEDVNDPEVCDDGAPVCQYETSYPIVVTGCGGHPCSEDVLISSNVVRENEVWVGIMNHGGQRVLVFDNEVYDTNFLYANTITPGLVYPAASDDTVFVENYGDILPTAVGGRYDLYPPNRKGEGIWFVALDGLPAHRVMAIGNVLRNTGHANFHAGIVSWAGVNSTFTWNEIESDAVYAPPQTGIRIAPAAEIFEDGAIAHNTIEATHHGIWSRPDIAHDDLAAFNHLTAGSIGMRVDTSGTWDIRDNDFAVAAQPILGAYKPISIVTKPPPAPKFISAVPGKAIGEVVLRWPYSEPPHDSFYIETRVLRGRWHRVAFRPPNLAKWRFSAPSNPNWRTFTPTIYVARGLPSGQTREFRIRAHHREAVSAWSPASKLVVVP